MNKRLIHSVGIDIGTTTTQVIFSELELVNRAPASQVPHYEFSRRDIVYVSPVVFTPIDDFGSINQDALRAFIVGQYKAAGFDTAQIESGAIIITGETSKAKNARNTIMDLALELGDFVVATAGPHLESIIAGQGSGAAEYSKTHASRVLNIDIGGGTANYAVFENGRVVDTACLNVGGHLVETHENGQIRFVRTPAKIMSEQCFGASVDPMNLTEAQLATLMNYMATLVMEVVNGTPSDTAEKLLMTNGLAPNQKYQQIFISGGVGECFYAPETVSNPFMFKDTGPLLAKALANFPELVALAKTKPNQTVRATVIGAGAHTLSLSGSTIWLNAEHLPIKNIPVLQSGLVCEQVNVDVLVEAWALASVRMDLDANTDLYALSLPEGIKVNYQNVLELCKALQKFSQKYPNKNHPLLVISKQDLGKVLGMELQPLLQGRELAVIDEVDTREGDYIDIGKPFFGADVVPLTVKSLAFPS